MKVRATLEVDEVTQSLGDKTPIYNTCGSPLGICEECLEANRLAGCGNLYTVDMIAAPEGPTLLSLPVGIAIPATDVKVLLEETSHEKTEFYCPGCSEYSEVDLYYLAPGRAKILCSVCGTEWQVSIDYTEVEQED